MVSYRLIAVAGFLASVNALPLNINLGAYSPALVVGDGEISFGGGQDVTSLMNALEGAAVNAAGGAAGGAGAGAGAREGAAVVAPAAPAQGQPGQEAVAAQSVQNVEATPAVDPNLQEQATQISALQGMGKEIAPRDGEEAPKAKRDLAGFDRALLYAEAALTKGPIVQLGTGEGGSGVGVIVDNTNGRVGSGQPQAAPAVGAAPVAGAPAEKRDETSAQPRRRTKVTRMYVKRGIPAAMQESNEFQARDIESLPVIDLPALSKRESTETIDSINLNVAGDEGITMTFVETEDVEDEEVIE